MKKIGKLSDEALEQINGAGDSAALAEMRRRMAEARCSRRERIHDVSDPNEGDDNGDE